MIQFYPPFYSKTEEPRDFRNSKVRKQDKFRRDLFSTLEHMQVQKWNRTRCQEELTSSFGMRHPLQMFYRNLTQILGKTSNSVIRSRSVKGQNWCYVSSMEGVTVYGNHPECRVSFIFYQYVENIEEPNRHVYHSNNNDLLIQ